MRLTRAATWNRWLAALAVLGFALVWASGARAQTTTDPSTVRFTCGTGTTCTIVSGTTIITDNVSPNLAFTETNGKYSGEAFLVVLVPDTESSTFTVNEGSTSETVTSFGNWTSGTLLTTSSSTGLLGVDSSNSNGQAVPAGSFSSFTPISDLYTTSSVTGYNVYVVDLGSYSGTPIDFSFGGDPLPAGTVLWGFVTDSSTSTCSISGGSFSTGCAGADGMPYSSTITITPEPATLGLVGCGFLLLGLIIRRREMGRA